MEGQRVEVVRDAGYVRLVHANNAMSRVYALPPQAANDLAALLVSAADEGPVERDKLVGQLGPYSVVRTGYHGVRLSDHPDWAEHSGWTLRLDQAGELSAELVKAASAGCLRP